jgi:hypothetical protein
VTLRQNWLVLTFAAFTCYAAIFAVLGGGEDKAWAAWATAGYGLATVVLWLGRRWPGAVWLALGCALTLALVAPLIWNSLQFRLEDGMVVIDRGASLLLHHGSPYLPDDQLRTYLSYNPYLPVMMVTGLPHVAGWPGLLGNAGVWLAVASVAVIVAAFCVALPRRLALLAAGIAIASPVVALNLAVITTDPPVLGFMLLSLAIAGTRRGVAGAAVALAVACVLKDIAWVAIPVMAALYLSRGGWRLAARFVVVLVAAAVVLIVAFAPAAVVRPGPLIRDTVLFPLGLTKITTPAASLTPGHLLASLGHAGHLLSVGLLLAAGLGILISLFVWPLRTVQAVAWRLAIGLTLVFALGPDVRFGYFIYPIGLAGWVLLTRPDLYTIVDRDSDVLEIGAEDASSSSGQARRA